MNKKEKEILIKSYQAALFSDDTNLSNHMECLLNTLGMNTEVIDIKNTNIISKLPLNENTVYIMYSFGNIYNVFKKYNVIVLYNLDEIEGIFENLIFDMTEDDILIVKNEINKLKRFL